MRIATKEICVSGLFGAFLMVFQVGLSGLPNIEPVSALLICWTIVRGKKALYASVTFSLLEIIIWGFGLWNIMYLYIWNILVLVVLLLRKNVKRTVTWSLVSAIYGLSFGALCSIVYIPFGIVNLITWWVSGLSFDLLHAIGNFFMTMCLMPIFLPIIRRVDSIV